MTVTTEVGSDSSPSGLDAIDGSQASGEALNGIIPTLRSRALPFVVKRARFPKSYFSPTTLPTDKRPRLKTYRPFQVGPLPRTTVRV
jgi:hypothetical protein